MAFIWITKRSGQRARGGGCIGCMPFGCVTGVALLTALIVLLIA